MSGTETPHTMGKVQSGTPVAASQSGSVFGYGTISEGGYFTESVTDRCHENDFMGSQSGGAFGSDTIPVAEGEYFTEPITDRRRNNDVMGSQSGGEEFGSDTIPVADGEYFTEQADQWNSPEPIGNRRRENDVIDGSVSQPGSPEIIQRNMDETIQQTLEVAPGEYFTELEPEHIHNHSSMPSPLRHSHKPSQRQDDVIGSQSQPVIATYKGQSDQWDASASTAVHEHGERFQNDVMCSQSQLIAVSETGGIFASQPSASQLGPAARSDHMSKVGAGNSGQFKVPVPPPAMVILPSRLRKRELVRVCFPRVDW